MRTTSFVTLLTAATILGSAGFAMADNKPALQGKMRPAMGEIQKLISKDLARKHLKEDRGSLVGPIQFGICTTAKAAEGKYETCEDSCADWASQQPLTGADLASCGDDMSAAACADKIVDAKSRACIRMTGTPGCRDEQVSLIKAREACQDCKEELTKIAALNKQKAAKEAEIAKLQQQLSAANSEAQKIDGELEKLGKPCASSKPSDSAGKDASGKGVSTAQRNPAAQKK